MNWISVKEKLPTDFNEHGRTKNYLVYIDNPFFTDANYHVSWYQESLFGQKYWANIEANVYRGDDTPNVTHWCELPNKP